MLHFLSFVGEMIGGFAAITAATVYLTRAIIEHSLRKELEEHKVKLSQEASVELEKLKNQLRSEAFRNETTFQKMHFEVFQALVDVNPQLIRFHNSVIDYLAVVRFGDEPPREEQLKTAADELKKTYEIYNAKRILIPKHIRIRIDELLSACTQAARDFSFWLQQERRMMRPEDYVDPWKLAVEAIKGKIRPLIDLLEDEMQHQLGIIHAQPPQAPGPPSGPTVVSVPS